MKKHFKQDWKYADWDKLKEAQLKEMADLPLSKKIDWLDYMQTIITNLQSNNKSRNKL